VAIEEAARIAAHDKAALHVLHAFDAPWHALHWRAPTIGTDPAFQKQYRAALERRLDAFTREMKGDVATVKPKLALVDLKGHRSAIVEYAQEVGADLIVLGTRGKSNVRDLLLGSTAEKVLRDTLCSMLAIKPEGFENPLAKGEGQPPSEERIEV
jgi:nucleotide-binding universal stress UspA family protein